MKTSYISTSAISAATRSSVIKTQEKLAAAQKEVTTGRLADVGASLGYKTGQTISLRQDYARLKTIIDTNAVVSTRLSASQAALKSLSDDAQLFVGQLIGARNAESGPTVVQAQAKAALVSFTNTINTALDGAHLFAGINADVKPITDYYANPTAQNRQSVGSPYVQMQWPCAMGEKTAWPTRMNRAAARHASRKRDSRTAGSGCEYGLAR